jgi:tRNA dimethylallyltransferase
MRIAILGPTASGKSALAVEIARRIEGTVVNGDPFQSLAGLEIGTGQPDERERQGVPHVGFGILPLSYRPNPLDFGSKVRGWLAATERAVVVTGSGLYLRGIWEQLDELPAVPEPVREKVRALALSLGPPRLHRYLASVDRARAAQLHPNDSSRLQRALALHLATGRRPSSLVEGVRRGVPEGWSALVALPSREIQRGRVLRRVRAQAAAGWQAEVSRLVAEGFGPDLEVLRPLGYAEWLAGGDPGAILRRIVQATQAYAKRQSTFFRNQWPEIQAWDPDREGTAAAFLKLGL